MRATVFLTALLALSLTALPAPAAENVTLADFTYQDWSHPKRGDPLPVSGPIIRVYSRDGDRFDFVGHTNRPVRFHGVLSGACARINKISYLQLKVADTTASVSHPDGRGAWFSRTGTVEVPHAALQQFDAVRACNDKLETLAAETGRSRNELVADGFGIRFSNRIEGRGILMCSGRNNSDSDTEQFDLWVECVGRPEAADEGPPKMKAVKATLAPLITDLTYQVDRPSYAGKCPVGLQFTGSITTSRKGTVKYKTIAHDGSTSPTYTLTFDAAGTKPIGVWGETLSEPEPSATLSAESGGETGPDFSGWRRLEIVEPEGFAPSPPAEYTVTCQKQPLTLGASPVKPTSPPKRIKN